MWAALLKGAIVSSSGGLALRTSLFPYSSCDSFLSVDLFSLGHGIINVDGELWKAQRKAGLAFLNTATLRVLTDVALPQYLSQSIEHLEEKEADGSIVDLQHVFHEITTQLMGKMAYNVRKRMSHAP